jgi:hypothetical protein
MGISVDGRPNVRAGKADMIAFALVAVLGFVRHLPAAWPGRPGWALDIETAVVWPAACAPSSRPTGQGPHIARLLVELSRPDMR